MMEYKTLFDLPQNLQTLLREAEKAMNTAYNPYSNFNVGAALLTLDGEMISASNVENAAYGSTICAERLAIGKANSMGHRIFSHLATIGRGKLEATDPVTPCGPCRQMLYEFSDLGETPLVVIASNTKADRILVKTIDELLPYAFSARNLGIDVTRFKT